MLCNVIVDSLSYMLCNPGNGFLPSTCLVCALAQVACNGLGGLQLPFGLQKMTLVPIKNHWFPRAYGAEEAKPTRAPLKSTMHAAPKDFASTHRAPRSPCPQQKVDKTTDF
jgi:hypothetical protein